MARPLFRRADTATPAIDNDADFATLAAAKTA
jgi:hypothetical protein